MAVRAFDLTGNRPSRLGVLEPAPRRRDLRRTKQRAAMVGIIALSAPFLVVLVLLGVAH